MWRLYEMPRIKHLAPECFISSWHSEFINYYCYRTLCLFYRQWDQIGPHISAGSICFLLQIWVSGWEPVSESICCWKYNIKHILPCGLRTCADCGEMGEKLYNIIADTEMVRVWGIPNPCFCFPLSLVLLLSLGFRKYAVPSMHRLVYWFLSVCPLISSLCHLLLCPLPWGLVVGLLSPRIPCSGSHMLLPCGFIFELFFAELNFNPDVLQ